MLCEEAGRSGSESGAFQRSCREGQTNEVTRIKEDRIKSIK
jgi:hypothetical protein